MDPEHAKILAAKADKELKDSVREIGRRSNDARGAAVISRARDAQGFKRGHDGDWL